MSVEKTFHCYNGHAFALIAGGSDGLRAWAVGHYGINVYLVAAGITRWRKHPAYWAKLPACSETVNQARRSVARRLEPYVTCDKKRVLAFVLESSSFAR